MYVCICICVGECEGITFFGVSEELYVNERWSARLVIHN